LKKYSTILNSEMRSVYYQYFSWIKSSNSYFRKQLFKTFCRCLMLLRSKNLIEPVPLFDTFFSLMKCQDKALRTDLYTHMVNDVKKIKTKLKNYKLCTVSVKY
jgi:protein SDA1